MVKSKSNVWLLNLLSIKNLHWNTEATAKSAVDSTNGFAALKVTKSLSLPCLKNSHWDRQGKSNGCFETHTKVHLPHSGGQVPNPYHVRNICENCRVTLLFWFLFLQVEVHFSSEITCFYKSSYKKWHSWFKIIFFFLTKMLFIAEMGVGWDFRQKIFRGHMVNDRGLMEGRAS